MCNHVLATRQVVPSRHNISFTRLCKYRDMIITDGQIRQAKKKRKSPA